MQLPSRPDLDQYKKQAKELVKDRNAGDPEAIRLVEQHHPRAARRSAGKRRRRRTSGSRRNSGKRPKKPPDSRPIPKNTRSRRLRMKRRSRTSCAPSVSAIRGGNGFRGEDVIAVDFGPNPGYKPKKAIENYLQKPTGVVLIDDHAHDVARLEAHVDNSIRVGGGVPASLDKGSSFVFEQARINDEVWLPSYAEVHVGGHALLLLKLKANVIARYTDYKKFHSDSKVVGIDDRGTQE
jgi:hypothetical protein